MKNCLCCGKPLPEQDEKSGTGWHQKCIRKFFGTEQLPETVFPGRDGILAISVADSLYGADCACPAV